MLTQPAAIASLLSDVFGGCPTAATVRALAHREAFMSLLRNADPELVALELGAEQRRMDNAFRGVPGYSPGPALCLGRAAWFLLFGPALERNAQQPVYRLIAELGTTFVLESQPACARTEELVSSPSRLPHRLAVPAHAGVALSRDDTIRLTVSLKLQLPPENATLEALLVHLFASAERARVTGELSARLSLEFRARIDRYSQWGMLYPALVVDCWDLRTRASDTLQLLAVFGAAG